MTAYRLGLTGSIGMGKSTTAAMFAELGLPVWDADAAVHRLYASGGAAVKPLSQLHPPALIDGGIDRAALKVWIAADPTALRQLETTVHPLVAADRAEFIKGTPGDIVVLDIPLLFETGAETTLDATLLVTAPPELQRARVLARPGMTQQQFDLILSRQMPDPEKRRRATHIIETLSISSVRAGVEALVDYIRSRRDA
ncbi:dephospho-CoA kinase [Tabrizicola sp. J26]|uniref:dephospho-CoA kinase n=1 Tax=Alitabrizicola rongguiensis TaxID=2909234 RepID=UPI001EEBE4F2|nr:dephospho-CoA kinase [Tabrizicola rongguiensis]MCF1708215.1 dephospho-CoA kinase [Tabrizicola rongguiensis]